MIAAPDTALSSARPFACAAAIAIAKATGSASSSVTPASATELRSGMAMISPTGARVMMVRHRSKRSSRWR